MNRFYTNEQIHAHYTEWCHRAGRSPLPLAAWLRARHPDMNRMDAALAQQNARTVQFPTLQVVK